MHQTKNTIELDVKGGFGNQLFFLATAIHFIDQGFETVIDTSWFSYKKNRKLSVPFEKLIDCYENVHIGTSLPRHFCKKLTYRLMREIKISEFRALDTLFIAEQLNSSPVDHKFFTERSSSRIFTNSFCQGISFSERTIFKTRDFINNYIFSLNEIREPRDTIIQVRKGDIENNSLYAQLDSNYYNRAIENINSSLNRQCDVSICTDDVSWCKDNLPPEYQILSIESDFFGDFASLANAKNLVISNSTFGLWSAMLNEGNGVIVGPQDWFVKNNSNPIITHLKNASVIGI